MNLISTHNIRTHAVNEAKRIAQLGGKAKVIAAKFDPRTGREYKFTKYLVYGKQYFE